MRSVREVLHKKLLKRIAFPLLNRLLEEERTHLYHYSPVYDRLFPISGFGSQTYRYLKTGELDSDRWWNCVRTLAPGGTILDVGANVGFTSAWFAAVADRVHAFEAHPVNVELIHQQLRIRGITNVEVRQTALSAADDTVDLYCKPRAGHHSLADIGASATIGRIQVPCTTLDRFLSTECLDEIRLLKIDVEGFEPDVMYGARESLETGRIPRLLFEYSPAFYRERGLESTAPLDYLTELGFSLFSTDLKPFEVHHRTSSGQCDLIALAPGIRWETSQAS
jgi:FkbM family methyltransferase